MRIEEIKYGDYSAKINVSRGSNCISLRNEKYDCKILREPNYEEGIDNPYLYGMPILFPVNRISGGIFTFEDRTYRFPINEEATNCFVHGLLHETPFEILEQDVHSILLSYQATKESPYLTFPHAFEIRMKYDLSREGLLLETEIHNQSTENMPVFLGFHTTFNIPFINDAKGEKQLVKVACAEEFERDMIVYLPTGKLLAFDEVSRNLAAGTFVPDRMISRHYRIAQDSVMSITDVETGLSVVYENSPELPYRLIYGGCDFICLEPQTCLANCANSPFPREKAGFLYVKPGETKRFWSRISLHMSS